MEKLKVDELKARCKAAGMVQSGEKPTLIMRLQLHAACQSKDLKTFDGTNPCTLNVAGLRTASAKEGLSPIGSQDELLEALVKHLEKKAPAAAKVAGAAPSGADQSVDAAAVCERVLELAETDNWEAILSLASPGMQLDRSSPASALRKAYLKLAMLVHPDKLANVPDATKAFQACVKAFERLSAPELPSETKSTGPKAQTLARSNDGCFRTRVCCPRCKQPWSESGLDGNPEYCYNFLMQGLKQYTCSTCLCEFGCMTALHLCPHCRDRFEYSPADYHRKIGCGNSKKPCKPFGFWMYHASDRVLNTLRDEIRAEVEKRQRERDSKQRRAARSSARGSGVDSERAFMLGLVDECPRCGESLESYEDEAQRQHLMECVDERKHRAHQQHVAKTAQRASKREAAQDAQLSAQSTAAWQFLGSKSSEMWLLDDKALKAQALEHHVDVDGDREAVLTRLAQSSAATMKLTDANAQKRNAMMLTHDSTQVVPSDSKRQRVEHQPRLDARALPTNLSLLSLQQLRAAVAAQGALDLLPANASKAQVLSIIQRQITGASDSDSESSEEGDEASSEEEDDVIVLD